MKEKVLQVNGLRKNYVTRSETIHALKDVSFDIEKGEIIAVMGPSGSGKTTLLNIIGCMDKATTGKVLIKEKDISKLTKADMLEVRRRYLGFIFQDNHLVPTLTAIENVSLPLIFSGEKPLNLKNALLDQIPGTLLYSNKKE